MLQLKTIFWSSVGKKVISAATGLALIIFSTGHLLGNLALLRGDPDPFNKYTHFLEGFGFLLYVIELSLVAVFLFHICSEQSYLVIKVHDSGPLANKIDILLPFPLFS